MTELSIADRKGGSAPSTHLHGVFAAALTPVTADLRPDPAHAVRHCRRLLDGGCDGINLLGTTGEATSFSVAQRIAVMEAIAEELPLDRFMVGTGASALDDTVTLTRAAVALGFAGALVVPPFYFKGVSEGGVFASVAALIERVADPRLQLYLYHFPALSGVPFTLPLVERLVHAYPETVAGLKDSSGDMAYADSVVAAFPHLAIFPSTEAILLDARARGFAGCISATANVTAPLAAKVWHAEPGAANAASDQAALTQIRVTIGRRPLVPAIRHTTARLFADAALARMMPPLDALDDIEARALADELDAQPAFHALTHAGKGNE